MAYRELCDRAALHVHVREQILFPLLRRKSWTGQASDAMVAHQGFKRALAHLLIGSPEDADFEAHLDVFAHALHAQLDADRRVLIPVLRRLADLSERRSLCLEVELAYLAMSSASVLESIEDTASPQELVDEAKVVLSSLPGEAATQPPQRHGRAGRWWYGIESAALLEAE